MRFWFCLWTLVLLFSAPKIDAQQNRGTLVVNVQSQAQPIALAEVVAGDRRALTDQSGEAVLEPPTGPVTVTIESPGFLPQTVMAMISMDSSTRIEVELQIEILNQEITVTATRTERRIEDTPMRVEVIQQEEIVEKALMTPGDIAMLLNETAGLRVQVTSPSLGAANVRVQGLRGRYTQLLADGLPLYGGQTGAIGLLQIPPLDLGQVEVIKGVGSALYGSSALGGVINLVSRRPAERERELLLNRTSLNGSDAVFWLAEPGTNRWGYSLIGGAHLQETADVDNDGWADLPGFRRGVLRPRFVWEDQDGNSVFATLGVMAEDREGGTIRGASLPDGQPFQEELTSERLDAGLVGRFLIGTRVLSLRASTVTQWHSHQFGQRTERDRHQTWFGEASIMGEQGAHAWLVGTALQTDSYRGRDIDRFDYTYTVPAVFVQDDYTVGSRTTLSGSARLDVHSDYGTFFNPRISALFRLPNAFTARLSGGTGVFAPTPFTEETEAVGLSDLAPLTDLEAERAWSISADIGWSTPLIELTGTIFGSSISNPIELRAARPGSSGRLEIVNSEGNVHTAGVELLTRWRRGDFAATLTHTFLRSTELGIDGRETVALTPRHASGFVGVWEREGRSRIGFEMFYTGSQRLDDNPYRTEAEPYWVFGILAEQRIGRFRLFVNGENLGNTRQTRYEPLVRPQRNFDGRWTVDAWAPLEGRAINGGIRLSF